MRPRHLALLCATTVATTLLSAAPAGAMTDPIAPRVLQFPTVSQVRAHPRVVPKIVLTAVQRRLAADLRGQVLGALRNGSASTRAVEVHVRGLGVVVRSNATVPLRPASTQKLFMAVATLLGDAGRPLRTEVRGFGAVSGGRLAGDLVLRGSGDPSLSGRDLVGLARAVRRHGIRVVRGGLWGDDTLFDRGRRAPGWKADFVPGESGPLSALVVDRNGWRSDRGYLHNPVPANLAQFRRALSAAGVRVVGASRVGRPSHGTRLLAVHHSRPVRALVRHALKVSDNMYAEQLLKVLGATKGNGSTPGGLAVARAAARSMGARPVRMVDGSGLSAYDRQTAAGEVALLEGASRTRAAWTLRWSLPIGCHDGTLVHRFCGTRAAGRVWAKTGTLDRVRTLSGYTVTRTGRLVTFSVLLSGVRDMHAAQVAIDRAVVAMASSRL